MPRFTKANRLLKPNEFSQVMNDGVKIVLPAAILRVATGTEVTRLGLIVSRKVGNAVERNLIKRRLREIFRHEAGAFAAPCRIVVIARREALQLDFQTLQRHIVQAMHRGARRLGQPTS